MAATTFAVAAASVETGGVGHNRRYVAPALEVAPGVREELVVLAHDPQTSGGLLAAIPPDRLADVETGLHRVGVHASRVDRARPRRDQASRSSEVTLAHREVPSLHNRSPRSRSSALDRLRLSCGARARQA
ncbi:MAG TPA: hypothetical protein VIK32_17625 [Candidatus Limnocylindrales bacterium]